jgi:hypothetical protein
MKLRKWKMFNPTNKVHPDDNQPVLTDVCVNCLARDNSNKFFTCGRCRHASYCSKKCEEEYWPQHKDSCEQFLLQHMQAAATCGVDCTRAIENFKNKYSMTLSIIGKCLMSTEEDQNSVLFIDAMYMPDNSDRTKIQIISYDIRPQCELLYISDSVYEQVISLMSRSERNSISRYTAIVLYVTSSSSKGAICRSFVTGELGTPKLSIPDYIDAINLGVDL